MFPAKQPSKVVVRTTDGQEFSEYLEYPKGDPREKMTDEDLTSKFSALADGLLSPDRQGDVKDMIYTCEKLDAREFMAKLVV
jgi:2-methylcitrate dehydratase